MLQLESGPTTEDQLRADFHEATRLSPGPLMQICDQIDDLPEEEILVSVLELASQPATPVADRNSADQSRAVRIVEEECTRLRSE